MIFTKEIFEQGRSRYGGWSNDQFRALGVLDADRKKKGWLKKIINTDIDGQKVIKFLELKDKHLDDELSHDQISLFKYNI